jgi:hypothetical protein
MRLRSEVWDGLQIFNTYDLGHCCMAYDGNCIKTHHRARRDLALRAIILDPERLNVRSASRAIRHAMVLGLQGFNALCGPEVRRTIWDCLGARGANLEKGIQEGDEKR